MAIALSLLGVTLLLTYYYLRNFFRHSAKVKALSLQGVAAQGQLLEARNEGLQANSGSSLHEITVKFPASGGKDQLVRYKTALKEGEIIAVGSVVDLVYLPEDPSIYNIPALGVYAKRNWQPLVTGLVILLAGVFAAYVVFINSEVS